MHLPSPTLQVFLDASSSARRALLSDAYMKLHLISGGAFRHDNAGRTQKARDRVDVSIGYHNTNIVTLTTHLIRTESKSNDIMPDNTYGLTLACIYRRNRKLGECSPASNLLHQLTHHILPTTSPTHSPTQRLILMQGQCIQHAEEALAFLAASRAHTCNRRLYPPPPSTIAAVTQAKAAVCRGEPTHPEGAPLEEAHS